jgi:hypothetical protein
MKITATTNQKKEVFKPITVTLQIVIESKDELEELKVIGKNHDDNSFELIVNGDYYDNYGEIFKKITEQL